MGRNRKWRLYAAAKRQTLRECRRRLGPEERKPEYVQLQQIQFQRLGRAGEERWLISNEQREWRMAIQVCQCSWFSQAMGRTYAAVAGVVAGKTNGRAAANGSEVRCVGEAYSTSFGGSMSRATCTIDLKSRLILPAILTLFCRMQQRRQAFRTRCLLHPTAKTQVTS